MILDNTILIKMNNLTASSTNKMCIRDRKIIIPLFVSGVLGLWLPQVIGGGHVLVNYLNSEQLVLSTPVSYSHLDVYKRQVL